MTAKLTVAIVAGTRPEVIKMAPVYSAMKESAVLAPLFLATAQHREMLDQALAVFGIDADHDLDLMQPGQNLTDLTARTLGAVGGFLQERKIAALLVQGDTTTVLASAMAAFYEGIPVGHVEAGLRTHNMRSPFPEEMNRRLTTPLAEWCFAPTELSRANLLKEGVPENRIHVTGNTVIDALMGLKDAQASTSISPADIANRNQIPEGFSQRYLSERSEHPFLLVTGHRRESFGDGFHNICTAIRQLVDEHLDLGVLYPVHLNPKVKEPVHRLLGGHSRIALSSPCSYQDFVYLMSRCHFLLSDSGGVQEEAPSLGKPVLVMRDSTERPEGIEAGTCVLVGTDPERILRESNRLLGDPAEYERRSQLKNPYGDGRAAERICKILERALGEL